MTRKVKGALIQVAGAAVVLLGFVAGATMSKWASSTAMGAAIGLVIAVALIAAGGRLYRSGAKVRNPNWKPMKSFHLSR
jgi:hypothetical protein